MSELYSYPSNDYRSYLAHHGVKGMKWGVRRQERYEARRKAKYMQKYGITSSQYDSVRKKSLARHKKGTKIRNIYRGVRAGTTALAIAGNAAAGGAAVSALSEDGGAGTATAVGTMIGGAIGIGLMDAVTKAEWSIGRRIVDNVMESSEFEDMTKKK